MGTRTLRTSPGGPLRGEVAVPGDKSISHRALIFNGFASGRAVVRGRLRAEDVARTARCMEQLGVVLDGDAVLGRAGVLRAPCEPLDCGNSGTTMRLLMGLLAGQDFESSLTGDASLHRRPMDRVAVPLRQLGAVVETTEGRPPVRVLPGDLHGGAVRSPVASAQVKSAVLLAGLQTFGAIEYTEPRVSRDHTERMLGAMGVRLERTVGGDGAHTVHMAGGQALHAVDVVVPGDISSAAFLMVAAAIVPGSDLILRGVGVNPTRSGVLQVLARMGAELTIEAQPTGSGEPTATIRVRGSELKGTEIGGDEIPTLIDELPVLAVAAALASGETRIRDAAELRVKESDRIAATIGVLRSMGVDGDETEDGMVIQGLGPGGQLTAARVQAAGDHRIGMAAAVAGLRGRGETVVDGAEAIDTSFPEFPELLERTRA